MYLVRLFEDVKLCAYHAKRSTLQKEDMKLVPHIKGEF